MKLNIAVLSGDGIGPEIMDATIKVLKKIEQKFKHEFHFKEALVGATAIRQTSDPLPEATLNLCKTSDAVLFGAIGDLEFDNNPSASVRPEQGLLKLRKELGLFANIRPVKAFPSLITKSPLKKEIIQDVDFVIYRELTGGIYFGKKHLSEDGETASDLCEYSVYEIERIAKLAFETSLKRSRRMTLIDKANVLESSRLWRKTVTKMSASYPDVDVDFLFVDNAAMQMILNPRQFDVILTENMFGDIISDEGSVIGGSIGLLASASVGNQSAMFEPIHGSFPQGAGKNIANPIACILSASMLLDHFNLTKESLELKNAVEKSINQGFCTPDLDPKSKYGTKEVGEFIASCI